MDLILVANLLNCTSFDRLFKAELAIELVPKDVQLLKYL